MIEKSMDRIYEDLYDITSKNMQEAGQRLMMTKAAFMYKQKSEEGVFDISLCGDCDNESFLQIAYMGMLGRMPDPGAVLKWMEKASLDSSLFRRQLIETISASDEFRGRNVKIVNNVYNMALANNSRKVGRYSYKIRMFKKKAYFLAKKVYVKLPENSRKVIKRMLKR